MERPSIFYSPYIGVVFFIGKLSWIRHRPRDAVVLKCGRFRATHPKAWVRRQDAAFCVYQEWVIWRAQMVCVATIMVGWQVVCR